MSSNFSGSGKSAAAPPRIYRTSLTASIFLFLFGAVIVLAGLLSIWHYGITASIRTGDVFILLSLSLLYTFFGVYVMAVALRMKIVLYADAIEHHGMLFMKRLERHEIKGFRRIRARGEPIVRLIPVDPTLKPIYVNPGWGIDAALRAWLFSLPDLDALDIKREKDEVAADPLLGATPAERLRRNAQAKKTARYLQAAAIAIAVWAIIYPHPYGFVICLTASLPFLAIALMFMSGGGYRISLGEAKVRPGLALIFIAPTVALMIRALRDFHLVDGKDPSPFAAAGAVVFIGLMIFADRTLRSKIKPLLLYSAAMAGYGYGAGALANAMFDDSAAQTFKPIVIGQWIESGKSRTYHLTLSSWDFHAGPQEIQVSQSFYAQAKKGEPLCISLRQGALRMPWYVVGMCGNDADRQ